MTPSWYDVLGVDTDADESQVRERFRAEIADLDPTDRRFRLLSRAAEVLLDPVRRAQHDAELAAQDDDDAADEAWVETPIMTPVETPVVDPDEPDPAEPIEAATTPAAARRRGRTKQARTPKPAGTARGLLVTTVVLGVLALLLVVATVVSLARGGTDGDEAAGSGLPDSREVAAARAAAVAAIVPVLSYDYRHLEEDTEAARGYLTTAAAGEYLQFVNGVVLDNAQRNQVVVQAKVLASGVARTGKDRVDVVLFVDQATTNREVTTPGVTKNQVVVQMVDQGGSWLVSCLRTTPDGPCPQ